MVVSLTVSLTPGSTLCVFSLAKLGDQPKLAIDNIRLMN